MPQEQSKSFISHRIKAKVPSLVRAVRGAGLLIAMYGIAEKVGRAYFETVQGARQYTVPDALGHRMHVSSMISGMVEAGGTARHLCTQGRVRERPRGGRADV